MPATGWDDPLRLRLIIVIVSLVAGTLFVAGAGSYLLVRRASASTAESELASETESVARQAAEPAANPATLPLLLVRIGNFDGGGIVALTPAGSFTKPAPHGLTAAELDAKALESEEPVAGLEGPTVFAAVPLQLSTRQLRELGMPEQDEPVLVLTRRLAVADSGLGYYPLVAGIALAVSVVLAIGLARRLGRPLLDVVEATRRISAGDLDASVVAARRGVPELVTLATSVNAMTGSLRRARDQERQFLLNVSHELRTPLTSIKGYAQAIVDHAVDDAAAAAAIVGSEAERLERLVQDLLDLAKLDARRFSLAVSRVDAARIARQVVAGFEHPAAAAGLDLDYDLPAGLALWVDADPDRLAQVVANLVENALRFAHRRVVIGGAAAGPAGDGACTLWVQDDGAGIPADRLDRVFERHFSSDREGPRGRAGRRVGSGLGLAIVAELLEAMGGSISASSPAEEGRGTRMTVRLPPAGKS